MEKKAELLKALEKLQTDLYSKDYLLTWEKTEDELQATLLVAEVLKGLQEDKRPTRLFESGLAISQFRDNSTRTRFSFASACNLLGLAVQDLDEGKSQLAHGETVRETAVMVSFLAEVIGIRDDIYLGAGNTYMREVARSLEEAYREKVLAQRPSVINLQCDVDHPTQSLADLLHLKNVFGSLENLRGKKIAMTWAYSPSYGKPLSVPQGVIGLMSRFGMNVTLAYPEGYSLLEECAQLAKENSRKSGGNFEVTHSMEDAFQNADVVYPKSWAPFHIMKRRTELLRDGNSSALKELEKECLNNNAKYQSWECTEKKVQLTRGGKALYMHCLPADISGVSCKQGEVEASVFERYRVQTYREAGYKPFIIAAMILLSRFREPGRALSQLG